MTVNSNTHSRTKAKGTSNSLLISITDEFSQNCRPLNQVEPISTTMAVLVQAYLALKNMASTTRSSGNNIRVSNNAVVMSAPSVSEVPIKEF